MPREFIKLKMKNREQQLTVNSLMFVGINVCVFETKPSLRGLIFAVSSGLVSYLGT